MAKKKKIIWLFAGIFCFIVYFFAAARPIPLETILAPRWLSSLESAYPVLADGRLEETADVSDEGADFGALFPFALGSRFGYVDTNGRFSINQIKKGEIYLSENLWSEYETEPERIEVRDKFNEAALTIEDPQAYPCFLDGRIFLVGSEQNSLSELDRSGNVLWTYEFAAPLTCIDAAAGLVLTGSIDGAVELLDRSGKRVFFFEPGGSRYAVITGCAISRDASRLGIISGIDDQRFLLLERFDDANGEYQVVYHDFLGDGFRRPVHIAFIDQDRWIIFERQGGIGVYEISSRRETKIALEGEIKEIDKTGGDGLFFVINSISAGRKELVGLRLPGRVVIRAPFKSNGAFLGRSGSRLLVGGDSALASFELEKK
ncbi:MAG: WD40 repeat domain-containing protein [Treponema sp.]|nr:WD40 repeat domain-containing protein [Treponema sp.]